MSVRGADDTGRHSRLLLIDDNPDDRALVAGQLKCEFPLLEAVEIVDPASFDAALTAGPLSLVVTDFQLRWTDGLTILGIIKQRFPNTPVIMFTGTGTEETAVAAMKAGLDDYVVKSPSNPARIRSAARSALERAAQRKQLRGQEDRLRAVLATTADAIIAIDEEGLIDSLNPAAVKCFGYAEAEAIGRSVDELIPGFNQALRQWARAELAALKTSIVSNSWEVSGRAKDGTALALELSASHTILDGRPFFTCIMRDVAKRKEQERVLIEARDRAIEADNAKTAFLANISHEFRTPLNAIIGFGEIIAHQLYGPIGDVRYHGYAEDIVASGHHLLSLINDVLDISRVEAGRLELYLDMVDLGKVLRRQIELVLPQAARAGLQIDAEFADNFPRVVGDETRLRQIVLNLLSNAIKFTPSGGHITVSGWADPDHVAFAVSDTGIGMKPGDVPRALEPFRQLDNSFSKLHQGTGLGLAIVKRLVELHHGHLTIDTEPGRGTRVVVTLPLTATAAR